MEEGKRWVEGQGLLEWVGSHGNGFWQEYHPWRILRQTHSRFSRLWFTFRASARAMAPPSPMVLLENLQETMVMGWVWGLSSGTPSVPGVSSAVRSAARVFVLVSEGGPHLP